MDCTRFYDPTGQTYICISIYIRFGRLASSIIETEIASSVCLSVYLCISLYLCGLQWQLELLLVYYGKHWRRFRWWKGLRGKLRRTMCWKWRACFLSFVACLVLWRFLMSGKFSQGTNRSSKNLLSVDLIRTIGTIDSG